MKNTIRKFVTGAKLLSLVILGGCFLGFTMDVNQSGSEISATNSLDTAMKKESEPMPLYGNWETFTKKDGLPADKAYCVRIDGNRVLVGTSAGLAVYENNEWKI